MGIRAKFNAVDCCKLEHACRMIHAGFPACVGLGLEDCGPHRTGTADMTTVEARKLKHARPPTPKQRKKDNQHKSDSIHVPTFWGLLLDSSNDSEGALGGGTKLLRPSWELLGPPEACTKYLGP